MNKLSIGLPLLAAALAMAPAAMADSYVYTINGSNFSATLYLTATANDENGVTVSGVDTITSVAGTFKVNGTTYTINTPLAPETAKPGSNDTNFTTSADGEFLFDNLLYPGLTGNGILDWGDRVVLRWILHRDRNRYDRRMMQNAVDPLASAPQKLRIGHAATEELDLIAKRRDVLFPPAAEVVHTPHLVAALQRCLRQIGPDKASDTGNEESSVHSLRKVIRCPLTGQLAGQKYAP